jgi:bifunctional DNase/RNase
MPYAQKKKPTQSNHHTAILKYRILTAFLLLVILGFAAYILTPRELATSITNIYRSEMNTVGFADVKVSVENMGDFGYILLTNKCQQLKATVEPEQALSIYNGINNIVGPRPNAHDLAKDIFQTLGIDVVMVKITEARDDAYYSKMILRQGDTILNLDARPSDAVAIALRVHAPIYINETLLQTMGQKIC